MSLRKFNTRLLLIMGLVCAVTISINGQSKSIGLDEAISIASNNYAGLERDRLIVKQQNKLADSGPLKQPTQLYLSSEEFGANDQSGVHSINILQNFYVPRVGKAQKDYYKKGAAVAERELALTNQWLKLQVEQAFYQLLYAKQEKQLVSDNIVIYNNFLSVATSQLESGETGRIPQMAARSRLGQAQLEQEHSVEKYQIALTLFNQWLQSDITYMAKGELEYESSFLLDSTLLNNPHLQVFEAQRELALTKVETEKVQLLPQINSGFKLQTMSGNFPLFGYQLGVNVPLFKKAYQGRIQAAELGVKVREAELYNQEQELERTISEFRYRLEHQLHILEYIKQNLTPIVIDQSEVNLIAYEEGEIGYLEYLDGLEQVIKVKQQYLEALYKFNVLRIELNYWLGK